MSLEPKWNPLLPQPEDYEDENNRINEEDIPEIVQKDLETFDTKITQDSLADTFRIFNDQIRGSTLPPNTKMEPEPDEEPIVVFTDGSALENDTESARAGSGIFFGPNDSRNAAIKIPDELEPSDQVGEIIAIKEAIERCPPDIPMTIYSDSKYAINGLTKDVTKWEDEGFLTISNGPIIQATVACIRTRKARTSFVWVKGHSGNTGNEGADKLAGAGCRKDQPDLINMQLPKNLILPGAKLNAMTQSLAYKIIRQRKMKTDTYQEALDRKATRRNMAYAKGATTDAKGNAPPSSKIWRSVKHKDFPRNIRFFLWMLIHGAYKVGFHWEKIPGYEDWGKCQICGVR
jgi:ribonuclease HI